MPSEMLFRSSNNRKYDIFPQVMSGYKKKTATAATASTTQMARFQSQIRRPLKLTNGKKIITVSNSARGFPINKQVSTHVLTLSDNTVKLDSAHNP